MSLTAVKLMRGGSMDGKMDHVTDRNQSDYIIYHSQFFNIVIIYYLFCLCLEIILQFGRD